MELQERKLANLAAQSKKRELQELDDVETIGKSTERLLKAKAELAQSLVTVEARKSAGSVQEQQRKMVQAMGLERKELKSFGLHWAKSGQKIEGDTDQRFSHNKDGGSSSESASSSESGPSDPSSMLQHRAGVVEIGAEYQGMQNYEQKLLDPAEGITKSINDLKKTARDATYNMFHAMERAHSAETSAESQVDALMASRGKAASIAEKHLANEMSNKVNNADESHYTLLGGTVSDFGKNQLGDEKLGLQKLIKEEEESIRNDRNKELDNLNTVEKTVVESQDTSDQAVDHFWNAKLDEQSAEHLEAISAQARVEAEKYAAEGAKMAATAAGQKGQKDIDRDSDESAKCTVAACR